MTELKKNAHPLSAGYPVGFSPNQYIYHYTCMETAINYILNDGTLMFNPFVNVNDPKESEPSDWIFSYNKQDIPNPSEYIKRVSDYFKHNIKVSCFSKDDEIANNSQYSTDPCARGYAKPRMWATYGDNHKGVCLVFDKDVLKQIFQNQISSSDKLFYGSVRYGRLMPVDEWKSTFFKIKELKANFESTLNQKINDHHNIYFLYKHLDWVSENEYRYVLIGDEKKKVFLPFKEALTGIAVGMKASDNNIKSVVRLADELGVPVIQPNWGMMHSSQLLLNDAAISVLRG